MVKVKLNDHILVTLQFQRQVSGSRSMFERRLCDLQQGSRLGEWTELTG